MTLAGAHLFKLKDYTKGFIPENRVYLRNVQISILNEDDIESYKASLDLVEPMFPLELYDPNKSYAEIRLLFAPRRKAYFDETDNFRPVMQFDLFDMDPCQMIRYITRCEEIDAILDDSSGLEDDPEKQELREIAGLDPEYNDMYGCMMTYGYHNGCSKALLAERLSATPFVYGEYYLESIPGCSHYWSLARYICPICETNGLQAEYPCIQCHNNSIFDHQLIPSLVQDIICTQCTRRGPIGAACAHCNTVLSHYFCQTCKVLSLLPLDYEWFEHCPICNVCFSVHDKNNHVCLTEDRTCIICLSSLVLGGLTIRLRCHPEHVIHKSCLDKLGSNSYPLCPLDHKVVGEVDDFFFESAMTITRYARWFNSPKLQINGATAVLCYDCELVSLVPTITVSIGFCRHCFGTNVYFLDEWVIHGDQSIQAQISLKKGLFASDKNEVMIPPLRTSDYEVLKSDITQLMNGINLEFEAVGNAFSTALQLQPPSLRLNGGLDPLIDAT